MKKVLTVLLSKTSESRRQQHELNQGERVPRHINKQALRKFTWMASKKLLFPAPFLPTMTLCPAEKGSISLWLRKLRKPLITSCLMCMASRIGRPV